MAETLHGSRMKLLVSLLLLALSTVIIARSEEPGTITTVSGERFDEATVTGASVYGLSITHRGGVSFVRSYRSDVYVSNMATIPLGSQPLTQG